MDKVIIAEGKTTNEAINNGLKQLKTTKDRVNIKILEEEKKMFYSILTPRVVKVEMSLKDESELKKSKNIENKPERKITLLSSEEQEQAKDNIESFLKEFFNKISGETEYKIEPHEDGINVDITNKELGFLIGYRGETLYAFQDILSSIASKGLKNRARVILDIEGYKAKREKTLQELAEKMANTVIRTGKSMKLEPMKPYERKIIHSKLQENEKVQTKSMGEEPYRRIVISLNK